MTIAKPARETARSYRAPKLVQYGGMRELTASGSADGNEGGGGAAAGKKL
jgi:hypothetical protein